MVGDNTSSEPRTEHFAARGHWCSPECPCEIERLRSDLYKIANCFPDSTHPDVKFIQAAAQRVLDGEPV